MVNRISKKFAKKVEADKPTVHQVQTENIESDTHESQSFHTDVGRSKEIFPSQYDQDYYKDFKLFPSKKYNRRPGPLILEAYDEEIIGLEEELGVKPLPIVIDYRSDSDVDTIFYRLNQLDIDILKFIAKFRNVQKFHIYKQFRKIHGKKIEETIKRLFEFHLVSIYDFYRADQKNVTASAIVIARNGLLVLRRRGLMKARDMHHWFNDLNDQNELGPIRYWKCCDTYQILSQAKNFVGHNSRVVFTSQKFSFEKDVIEKDSITGENKKRGTIKETVFIPKIYLDGEIIMEGPDGLRYYDLYPVCTEEDVENLRNIFLLWGSFKVSNDNNDKRKNLLLIVDDIQMIENINKRWNIQEYSDNILFICLSVAQEMQITHSIFKYSKKNNSIGIVPFTID